MPDPTKLSEKNRAKLDGIVQQMISNNESEDNINFVVNDFKNKYSEKKNPVSSTSKDTKSDLAPKTGSLAGKNTQGFPEIDSNGIAPNYEQMKPAEENPIGKEKRLRKELANVKVTPENMDEVTAKTDALSATIKLNQSVKDQAKSKRVKELETSFYDATRNNNDDAVAEQRLNDVVNTNGIWNNVKSIAKKSYNTVVDAVSATSPTLIGLQSAKVNTDPLADEKKQAKQEALKNKENLSDVEITERAKELFKEKEKENLYLDRANSFLDNLDSKDKELLKQDRASKTEHLSDDNTKRLKYNAALRTVAENKIADYKKVESQLQKLKENGEAFPDDLYKQYVSLSTEIKNIGSSLQKNEEYILKNKKDLGTAQQEFDLFKREYGDLYNFTANISNSAGELALNALSGLEYIGTLGGNIDPGNKNKGVQEDLNAVGDYFKNERENLRKPVESVESVEGFINYTSDLVANQIPNLIATSTGAKGLAMIGMASAGQKFTEMNKEVSQGKASYSPLQMAVAPLLYGGAEVISEIPTLAILKKGGRVFESIAKNEAELLTKTAKQKATEWAKDYGVDMSKEIAGEQFTNFTQNFNDKYVLGKKDVNLLDNTGQVFKDTFTLTSILKASPQTFGVIAKPFQSKTDLGALDENSRKIIEFSKQLNTEGLTNIEKTVIQKQIDKVTAESSKIVNNTIGKISDMPGELYDEVVSLNSKAGEIKSQATAINDGNLSNKEELLKGLAEDYKALQEKRNGIIEGKTTVVDVLPLKEQETLKKQAMESLVTELNPDGSKNITITNEQVVERANEIYNESKKKEQSPTPEAQSQDDLKSGTYEYNGKIYKYDGTSLTDETGSNLYPFSFEQDSLLNQIKNKGKLIEEVQKPSESEKVETPTTENDIERTTKALQDISLNESEKYFEFYGKNKSIVDEYPKFKDFSEAYHKAKLDGSNPELVKVVEELLGKPKEVSPVEDVVAPSVEKPKLSKKEKSQVQEKVVNEPRVLLRSGKIGADAFFALPNEGVFGEVVDKVGSDEKVSAYQYPEDFKIKDLSKEVVFDDYMSNKMFEGLKEEGYDAAYVMEIDGSKVLHVINPEKLTLLDEKLPELRNNEATPPTNTSTDGNVRVGDQPNDAQGKNNNVPEAVKLKTNPGEVEKKLVEINKSIFGLDEQKSKASAVVMEKTIEIMAERAGISKEEMFDKIDFEKGDASTAEKLSKKGNALFQIIGQNAKLSKQTKGFLEDAKTLEKQGVDAKAIFLQTGWEKGIDGKWRYDMQEGIVEFKKTENGSLEDVLDYPELFDKYPEAKGIKIVFNDNMDMEGMFDASKNRIFINPSTGIKEAKVSLLHEIQHWVQKKEGFSKGGSVETAKATISEKINTEKNPSIKKALNGLKNLLFAKKVNAEKVNSELTRLEKLISKDDFELYQSIAGEVEARNVEKRYEMTANERRNTSLSETEDVGRDEQVVLFQGEQGAMLAEDGKYVIYALTNPNVSTPMHEMAHVYEHYLTEAERTVILENAGHNAWEKNTSEYFARGFEKYLADGIAPSPEMKTIFDNFKKWMTEIYNGITSSEISIKLSPEMKTVFDVMLGAKPSEGEAKVTTKRVKSVKDVEYDVDFDEKGSIIEIRSPKDGRKIEKFVERKVKPSKQNPTGKILSKNANYAKIEADAYGELTNNQQNTIEKEAQKVVDEKIRAFEPNDEYELALKYVAEGGKVKLSSAKSETGEKNAKAMKWAAGFNKEADLPSIENVAEKLMPYDSNLEESKIREALIDIYSTFESQNDVKKHLLEVYEENNAKKEEEELRAHIGQLSEKDFAMYQAIQAEDSYIEELSDKEVEEYYNQKLDENEQGQREYARAETANQRAENIAKGNEAEVGSEIQNGNPEGEKNGRGVGEVLNEQNRNSTLARERVQYEKITPKNAPKKLQQIIKDVANGLKSHVIYSRSKRRNTLGSYNPRNTLVRITKAGDIDTVAHELGHLLDDKMNILGSIPTAEKAKIDAQLKWYSDRGGSNPPAKYNAAQKAEYLQREGLAEFIRSYVANPSQTKILAPELLAHFEKTIDPKTQTVLTKFSEDYLDFANASGIEKTLSNIEEIDLPNKNKFVEWIKGFRQGEDKLTFTKMDKFYAEMANSNHFGIKAFKALLNIQGKTDLKSHENFEIISRVFLGINGKLENVFSTGMINAKNEKLKSKGGVFAKDSKGRTVYKDGTAMNLEWLVNGLDTTTEKSLKKDMGDVIALAVAERTIEYAQKFQRSDNLTGIGGSIETDLTTAVTTLNEYKDLEKTDKAKFDRIQEGVKRYRQMADATLQYAADKGRISQEQLEQIKQGNEYYVALNRNKELEPGEDLFSSFNTGTNGIGAAKEIIKKSKGGTATIENPYLSLLKNMNNIIKEADRNEVMLSFVEPLISTRNMGEGEPVDLSKIGFIANEGDAETIKVFRDGKLEKWKFDKDIYSSLKNIESIASNPIFTFLSKPSQLIRWTVTHNPVFYARNIVKDTQARMIVSNDHSSFKDMIHNSGDKELFELFGGSQAGHLHTSKESYAKTMQGTIKEITKKGGIVLNPIKWGEKYVKFLQTGENLNRIAEFNNSYKVAREKGMSDYDAGLYAAFQARDLMDFAVAGHTMREINKIVVFSNAGVQSLRKASKSFKNDPAGFAYRTALYSVFPSIAFAVLRNAMGDDEEYEDLPDNQRDMFFNFKTAATGDAWISIPKPYELGLFSAYVDRGISKIRGNDEAFDGITGTTMKLLMPFDESSFLGGLKPLIETKMNRDTYTDRSIVPEWESGKLLELRKGTDRSSLVGQKMSKLFKQAGMSVDPRNIDHILKGYGTYFANQGMAISDLAKKDRAQLNFWITKTGFAKDIPTYNSKSVKKATDLAIELGKINSGRMKGMRNDIEAFYSETDIKKRKELLNTIYKKSKEIADYYEKEKVKTLNKISKEEE